MALLLADRVKVRSLSTGTGTVTLASTVAGFQGFSVIGDENETYYGITDTNGNWEVGRGTYTAVTIGETTTEYLSRDSVVSSSNNNQLVDFPVGGKNVFCTFPSTVALDLIGGASSDTFKTISIAGQSSVVADSSTDTLTLVAGSGMTIITDAVTDTITFASSSTANTGDIAFSGNVLYNAVSSDQGITIAPGGESTSYIQVPGNLESDTTALRIGNASTGGVEILADKINYQGNITQSQQDNTTCLAGVDTVIYTASGQYQHAVKLFVMVEGFVDGDSLTNWQTQACDIIAVRGYVDNVVHVTVYGVTYSSTGAFATFDGQWNSISNRIEITCRPTSLTNSVIASVHAIEITSND